MARSKKSSAKRTHKVVVKSKRSVAKKHSTKKHSAKKVRKTSRKVSRKNSYGCGMNMKMCMGK